MTGRSPKDVSASVRAKLLDLAHATRRDFHALAMRYAVERMLVRINASRYRNAFVLKGAMLFVAWRLDESRTTMDLDLLGQGDPDPDGLVRTFREICRVPTEDDGLVFSADTIAASPIRAESVYDGVRVLIPVHLGVMAIRLQIDIGYGDSIVPPARSAEFPPLLSEKGPIIDAYAPESVIAEKFNAMVLLGMANSRMKDYYDIWLLSRSFDFDACLLGCAISSTFAKRQTPLTWAMPLGLSPEFGENQMKQRQWEGFLKRQKRIQAPMALKEVVQSVREFLQPFIMGNTPEKDSALRWSLRLVGKITQIFLEQESGYS